MLLAWNQKQYLALKMPDFAVLGHSCPAFLLQEGVILYQEQQK